MANNRAEQLALRANEILEGFTATFEANEKTPVHSPVGLLLVEGRRLMQEIAREFLLADQPATPQEQLYQAEKVALKVELLGVINKQLALENNRHIH